MYYLPGCFKLITCALFIVLISYIMNVFLKNDENLQVGLVIKFHNYVDANWVKQVHDYITENIINWDNRTLSKTVGRCWALCKDKNLTDVIQFDSGCTTHPVLIFDSFDSANAPENVSYAEATLPCFLKLRSSYIPNANLGIFTTHKIPKGFIFGPYEGVIRSIYGEEGQEASDNGYAWRIEVDDEDEMDFYIDGVNDTNSNWLRYVNSARYEEEQNLYPLMFNNSVYYITYKYLEPETELLVWYGYKYAEWLEIYVIANSTHDWGTDFAPSVADTICPSCPRTQGEKRIENEDEEEDEW